MSVLKTQFATAVALLEEKAALRDRVADWRKKAAGEGLAPGVPLKLAKEHLQDEEGRRKAAEQLEIEELYRKNLGLTWVREYRKRRDAKRSAGPQGADNVAQQYSGLSAIHGLFHNANAVPHVGDALHGGGDE